MLNGSTLNGAPLNGSPDDSHQPRYSGDPKFSNEQSFVVHILPAPLATFDVSSKLDGKTIVEIAHEISIQQVAYFASRPDELKRMNRRLFEELVAELFDGFGFAVELTKQTRDGGRDIIAVNADIFKTRYLIECKRPDEGNIIGPKPVRELYGVVEDEKATKGILATTATFSPEATLFLERNEWRLEGKDFDGVMEWLNRYLSMKNA